MNKTINMNLGGLIFHIDENAYALLKNYLEAVSNSLNEDVEGKTEIIADIEARISELLSEKTAQKQQAIQERSVSKQRGERPTAMLFQSHRPMNECKFLCCTLP